MPVQYRKAGPEERFALKRMQSLAFNLNFTEESARESIEKWRDNTVYCAADETGRVVSGLEAIPFTMWFDGHKVPMTGIGGVVSAPEARRGGHIKKLFRGVFDDAYESGAVFSHLFPFSYEYYRKFGYEQIGFAPQYTLPVAPARALPQTGRIEEFNKTPALAEQLKEVYEAFASRHNVMLSRSRQSWEKIFNITPFGADRLYYWTDQNGMPGAWVKFSKNTDTLTVLDMAWRDAAAMTGILQFLGLYEGNVKEISLRAAPELRPELYWPELHMIHTGQPQLLGMSRTLNVRRALELMRKPQSRGRAVIRVWDDFAAWNTETYQIEYENGAGSVTVTGKDPGAELSQGALTQLLLGIYDPHTVLHKNNTGSAGEIPLLCELFPKKSIFLWDYF